MTPAERLTAKKTARIIRAARKKLSLSQLSVSTRLEISQSALSKMEHGTLIPSVHQWFEFCTLTQIPVDSHLSGYIEKMGSTELKTSVHEGSFRLPKRYSVHRCSSVRSSLPFLTLMRAMLGEEKTRDFLESKDVDPDYFVELDNSLSLNFILDSARELMNLGKAREDVIQKLVEPVAMPRIHGAIGQYYHRCESSREVLQTAVAHAIAYECNFKYAIEEDPVDGLVFSVAPASHLKDIKYRNEPDLGDFLCKYKQRYFERLANFEGRLAGAQLTERVCHFHGADRCVYRLNFRS